MNRVLAGLTSDSGFNATDSTCGGRLKHRAAGHRPSSGMNTSVAGLAMLQRPAARPPVAGGRSVVN